MEPAHRKHRVRHRLSAGGIPHLVSRRASGASASARRGRTCGKVGSVWAPTGPATMVSPTGGCHHTFEWGRVLFRARYGLDRMAGRFSTCPSGSHAQPSDVTTRSTQGASAPSRTPTTPVPVS